MVEMKVEYSHEGSLFEGFLCYDETRGARLPAVMISHAWAGRGEFECNKARALAARGYVGFAIDLYGKGVLGANPEQNAALMQPLLNDRPKLQARLKVALAALVAHPMVDAKRVAAMGFCFGGLCVLDMARSGAAVQGVVSFHGLLTKPGNTDGQPIRAKVLVLHGHDDPMCPVAQVNAFEQEMTAVGVDWQVHAYGNTLHSFTNPEANDRSFGTLYSDSADRRSWVSLLNFLEEVLV